MALLREEMNNYSVNTCNISITGPFDSKGFRLSIDWRISIAVLLLLLSLFHLFTFIYLSLVLKKRVWDSAAKRFGLFFKLYFAMTFLFYAIVNFSTTSIYFIPCCYDYSMISFHSWIFKFHCIVSGTVITISCSLPS